MVTPPPQLPAPPRAPDAASISEARAEAFRDLAGAAPAERTRPRVLLAALTTDAGALTGDAVHVRELARALHRQGRLAALLAQAGGPAAPQGFPFRSLGGPRGSRLLRLLRLARQLVALRGAYEVIHTREPFGATVALVVGRRLGKRVVYEVNGTPARLRAYLRDPSPSPGARLYGRWFAGVLARMDAVAFVSDNEAREFQKGMPFLRPLVVENGVDAERYRPLSPEEVRATRRRWGVPDGAPLVSFVGWLSHDLGLADAVRAWPAVRARFPGATLLVVGDGPGRGALEAAIAEAGAAEGVRLAPWLPEPEAARVMGASDLGLSLYSRERLAVDHRSRSPYSIKLLCYLACGTPVITTVQTEFLAEAGVLRTVPIGAPRAFAEATAELLADPLRAAERRRRCRALILDGYTWDHTAERWTRILDRLP